MSNLPLRVPPHSILVEEELIGAILLNPSEAIPRIISIGVRPEDFYDRRNQALFDALMAMDSDRLDTVLIAENLKKLDALEKVGGYDRLIELQGLVCVEGHLSYYADIVLEKSRARKLITICSEAIDELYKEKDPDLLSAKVSNELDSVKPAKLDDMKQSVNEALQEFQDVANGKQLSLPYPYVNFQRRTGGLPLRTISPLLGRDKTGKSRLACSWVVYWALLGIPILVFAFEDGKNRYIQTLAATLGEYDSFGVWQKPSPLYVQKGERYIKKILELPITVVEEAMTAEQIVARIGQEVRKNGTKGVILDGFKDVIATNGENRTQQENHIFETMKHGALKHNVAILDIEHVSKKAEKGKWIDRGDIRGSNQRLDSSRHFLIYQDSGFSDSLLTEYGLYSDKNYVALHCAANSRGSNAIAVLKPELEKGRFLEIIKAVENENR